MDPDQEISPVLKFYNELSQGLNYLLPIKSLLNFDKIMFRKHLESI